MTVRAFVARKPDENHAGVYRWLLERNLKLYGVALRRWTRLGDIYLTGKLAAGAGDTEPRSTGCSGAVADTADASFNVIFELGFADSIRREWAWRRSRGESTANLAAFTHLDPGQTPTEPTSCTAHPRPGVQLRSRKLRAIPGRSTADSLARPRIDH